MINTKCESNITIKSFDKQKHAYTKENNNTFTFEGMFQMFILKT